MAEPERELSKEERVFRMRHSAAHIMAEAVIDLFPGTAFAIGPPIEHGFYYDFDVDRPFTPEDLKVIERRMRRTMKANHKFAQAVDGSPQTDHGSRLRAGRSESTTNGAEVPSF